MSEVAQTEGTGMRDGLLGKAKTALRLTSDAFDDEVDGLCRAARHDLMLSGVIEGKAKSDTDPLVVEAVMTYCKARFGLDNPDSDKYWQSYLSCERDMLNSQEYTAEGAKGL